MPGFSILMSCESQQYQALTVSELTQEVCHDKNMRATYDLHAPCLVVPNSYCCLP